MASGFVPEGEIDEMRLQIAEALSADLLEDEGALEYLVDYGVNRVGARTPDALGNWMRDMLRQAQRFLKGRTSGSAAKDITAFLMAVDEIGGRGPAG